MTSAIQVPYDGRPDVVWPDVVWPDVVWPDVAMALPVPDGVAVVVAVAGWVAATADTAPARPTTTQTPSAAAVRPRVRDIGAP